MSPVQGNRETGSKNRNVGKRVEKFEHEMKKLIMALNYEDQVPPDTGHLRKTPLSNAIQSYLDYLCDTIFDTDDDYMNNQRWKK